MTVKQTAGVAAPLPGRRTRHNFGLVSDVLEYMSRMTTGPGSFRFLVQPFVAILIGLRHGLTDHRLGRPPYFLLLWRLRGSERRRELGAGVRAIALPLVIGVAFSFVFQYVVLSTVRLLPAIGFGVVFIALPYVVSRGLTNRLSSARAGHGPA